MKKLFLVAALAASATLSSCTLGSIYSSNQNANLTRVDLSQKNYEVIKTVRKQATATYIFGIGGMSAKSLNANAYSEMLKQADLKGSQALINIQTEIKTKIITPIYIKKIVTTTGQVVEFK